MHRPWRCIAFFYEQGIGVERDPQRAAAEYVARWKPAVSTQRRCAGRSAASCRPGTGNGARLPAILQERGLYLGALDAQVGPGTLGAARALAQQ
jgi:hypothetical protein